MWRKVCYEDHVQAVMEEQSTTDWLKQAIVQLDKRDINDVLSDVQCLYDLFYKKANELK